MKVVCFGELLLRLSPELDRKWIRRSVTNIHISGAELNVAFALAKWNIPVGYCTSLPDNYLGEEICEELKEKILTSAVSIFQAKGSALTICQTGWKLKVRALFMTGKILRSVN